MRVLTFSCLHVYPNRTLGSDALASTVQWLVSEVQRVQATAVVFLGDTLETSSKTTVPVNLTVKWVLDCFKQLAASGVRVFWLVGNHDIYSKELNALQVFDTTGLFTLVSSPLSVDMGACKFVFLPYLQVMDSDDRWYDQVDLLKVGIPFDKPAALFGHVPIDGVPIGGTKDRGIPAADLAGPFDIVFDGHYHTAACHGEPVLGTPVPVVMPGCVMGQTFKDAGWFHGAVVWDFIPGSTDAPAGLVHWLPNPHSCYFYSGPSSEYEAILAANEVVQTVKPRTHVRFTDKAAEGQGHEGLASVQVRPQAELATVSGKAPFRLDSSPEEDLRCWAQENGLTDRADELVLRAKKYLPTGTG